MLTLFEVGPSARQIGYQHKRAVFEREGGISLNLDAPAAQCARIDRDRFAALDNCEHRPLRLAVDDAVENCDLTLGRGRGELRDHVLRAGGAVPRTREHGRDCGSHRAKARALV